MTNINPEEQSVPGGISGLSGKFQILELLGTGGFAEVYKAIRNEDNLTVALKLPRISGFQTTQFSDFLKEADKWRRLSHPHIVKLIEFGERPIPYMVMELMTGGSLREKTGSLSIPESLTIASQVAEALFYAHHMGMAHLDIKPENILFDREGTAKLSDWGLSRVMLASSAGAAVSAGTLAYSAPEQVNPAKYGDRDWQTDIWQFGATLYEMVTGILPFPSKDVLELMHKILHEEPVPLPRARPDLLLSPQLENLIMRCLRKEKKERFRSFDAIQEGINIALSPPKPVASLEASPLSGEAPLEVSFRDKSTGSISSWRWDFGDGESIDEQNPSHAYQEPGNYRVALEVSGPGGQHAFTMNESIVVKRSEVKIKPGETSTDLQFSLDTVNCLGCCALGPVMVVDGEYYSKPTAKEIDQIFTVKEIEP